MSALNQESILNFFYTNLDTIAKIQDGHKLYINADNTINIEEPYMFQGIWRYCYNISRKDALHVLTKLFNDIEIYFNAIYVKTLEYKNRVNISTIKFDDADYNAFVTIISKLGSAVKGVENLQKTYADDNNTVNELSKIIEKIKTLISTFSNLI